MAMNPDTNRFEPAFLKEMLKAEEDGLLVEREDVARQKQEMLDAIESRLVRADGSPVPRSWTVFKLDEHVVIKDYTFKVAYIGETAILFEPVGPKDMTVDVGK
jgi:hypothetical protein